MPADHVAFCREMLPKVSRTFAACIRLLPPRLEWPVLIAYLLCRVADTAEDDPRRDADEKGRLLAAWKTAVVDLDATAAGTFATAFTNPATDDERLAAGAVTVLQAYRSLSAGERAAIAPWVAEMCDGMADFARRHPQAAPGRIQALATLDDLDRYCYYVAGTVGHLLTALFTHHSHRIGPARQRRLEALATSFGLGLQLTNIIKDVADDRRRGWSFVPHDLHADHGVAVDDLLARGREPAARALIARLIAKAARHLRDALSYCLALPRGDWRIRLFCLTPLYFAVRTLRLAESDPRLLDPTHKVKITRNQVYRTLIAGAVLAPSNRLVHAYFRRHDRRRLSTLTPVAGTP